MQENITQNNNVDNILKSVSDDILEKRKKRRMITFSVLSAICLALVITVITMSVVKINLMPYFVQPSTKIEVVVNGEHTATFNKTLSEGNYNKLVKEIEDSFDKVYLNALFSGEAGGYGIKETTDKFYSSYSDGVGSGKSSSLSSKLGKNYIHYQYDELQTLKTSKGRNYTSVYATGNNTIEYRDVYFTISQEDEWTETTFYFGSCTNRGNYTFSITVTANTSGVYSLVQGI